ncbi:MAG: NeuD/PglB/VioB family sugar acetyltransferase [Pseudomonadota bacterium]
MKKIILIGGGGHCKSCIDIIESTKQFEIIGILDTNDKINSSVLNYTIIGTDEDIEKYAAKDTYFLITIGQVNTHTIRKKIFDQLIRKQVNIATIISPNAYVSPYANIGKGSIIMHHAIVNAGATILENCIINTKAIIEHDSIISSHCHISTGAIINGSTTVLEGTFFGSNSVSIQGVKTKYADFIKAGNCYKGDSVKNTQNKIAFLTAIYPINEEYVHEFMDSLIKQSYKKFDLIILNDNFGDLEPIKNKYNQLHIIEISSHGNIAKNREALINYAKNNAYNILIFGDIDDKFENNRIETSINKLRNHDIVVNELESFKGKRTEKKDILSSRIDNNFEIKLDFILDKNIFGLSNTAIKIKNKNDLNIKLDPSLIAVDWYLFSYLLLSGYSAIFTNETTTYYRQHDANIVGSPHLDLENLKKTLNVKKIHFEKMSIIEPTLYNKRLMHLNLLNKRIEDINESNLVIEKNKLLFPLWWEIIE